jgi:hypothetical protein
MDPKGQQGKKGGADSNLAGLDPKPFSAMHDELARCRNTGGMENTADFLSILFKQL